MFVDALAMTLIFNKGIKGAFYQARNHNVRVFDFKQQQRALALVGIWIITYDEAHVFAQLDKVDGLKLSARGVLHHKRAKHEIEGSLLRIWVEYDRIFTNRHGCNHSTKKIDT